MTVLNEENLLDQKAEQIPGCAGAAEFYLRTLAAYARETQAPLTMDVRAIPITSGPGGKTENRLVFTPVEKRLRPFESLHFARPIGTALSVGYDLVGAKRARGLAGFVDLGGATQKVMDQLRELMDFVEGQIIVPAMHDTAASAGLS